MKKVAIFGSLVAILITFVFLKPVGGQQSQLQGYVRWQNGRPASNSTISIGEYAVTTDQHGHYSIGFLHPGRYVISISPPGRSTRSFWVNVSLGSNSRDFTVDW
jgi:hypothetical protein